MTTATDSSRRTVAIALVVAWAISTAVAFWWFEFRNLRSFLPEEAVMFRATDLDTAMTRRFNGERHSGPVVLHFWDPGCPCTRFSTPHVRQIMTQYGEKGVHFVVLMPDAGLAREAREAFGPHADIRVADDLDPVSSPAAMLLDGQGELAYFGPYSAGAGCTVAGGGFVETVLDALNEGVNPSQINTLAVGCFCRWPHLTRPNNDANQRATI